jgi:hypothetical protein
MTSNLKLTLVDGNTYDVAYSFTNERCLINYNGMIVFVDKDANGNWDFSKVLASPQEMPILQQLSGPDGTTLTITAPDGTTKTIKQD